jgi:hypothetical protein
MLRPRLAAAGALAVAALVGAGVAVASRNSQTTQQAAATFDAASVSQIHSTTCTSVDGVYQDANATYSGTSTSTDPRLSGPVTIQVHTILNTTTQLGWVSGTLRVRNTGGTGVTADLDAALAGGRAIGFLRADTRHDNGRLMSSFSSSFTPGAGFAGGELGAGSASNAGVIFTTGSCSQTKRFTATEVFRLDLTHNEVVPPVLGLRASASGNLTLDLSRDTSGTVTGGSVVFYLNYDFPSAVTITNLALYQGARGSNGAVVLDANVGTLTDNDGGGNLTKVVTGVSPSLLQALLADPHGYYVQLTTSANANGALRDQLENPSKR